MAILSDNAIATYASKAGFSGSGLVTAIAVALAESAGNPAAQHINRSQTGRIASIDRGLWQINSAAHPEVSDTCAFNPACCAGAAYRISAKGADWKQWTTYLSGAYRTYTDRALKASTGVPGGQPIGQTIGGIAQKIPPVPPGPPPVGVAIGSIPSLLGLAQSQAAADSKTETLAFGKTGANAADQTKRYYGPLRTILALFLFGAVLYGIAKTSAGKAAIFYGEALILLFLFATQAQYLREGLLPFLSQQPSETPPPQQQSLNQALDQLNLLNQQASQGAVT